VSGISKNNLDIDRYKMGPAEVHPWVLRELVVEVAKPLSITFEKTWQSSEVPGDWKRGNITPFLKTVKRKTEETTGQSHLCASQECGADPPGNHAKSHES